MSSETLPMPKGRCRRAHEIRIITNTNMGKKKAALLCVKCSHAHEIRIVNNTNMGNILVHVEEGLPLWERAQRSGSSRKS